MTRPLNMVNLATSKQIGIEKFQDEKVIHGKMWQLGALAGAPPFALGSVLNRDSI